ncbi:hypothetical protein RIF29_43352 [Crotalaria pallida]|uniref:Uncharacterized protein n=1 Tax=Crotalaria pallida TaxID=3830 RepID=A0AAN9DWY5_CROPI
MSFPGVKVRGLQRSVLSLDRHSRSRFHVKHSFENVYVASLYKSSLSESLIGKHSLCPSASVSYPPPLLSLKLALAWSKPTYLEWLVCESLPHRPEQEDLNMSSMKPQRCCLCLPKMPLTLMKETTVD